VHDLVRSWQRHLRARGLSPRTIETYAEAVALLHKHCGRDDPTAYGRSEVVDFISDQLARHSPATAAVRYRSLRQWFKWLCFEDEIDANPMDGLAPPKVPDKPPGVLGDDTLSALLRACDGKGFDDRRDMAIIRLFIDTGVRLSELTYGSVDLDLQEIAVVGKGRKERSVPFGDRTALAVDRYDRLRRRHPLAGSPVYWLGKRGPLTASGVRQAILRRCGLAGVPDVNPHAFRHTAASYWLEVGGQELDLQRLMGWADASMLRVYGRAEADRRARAAHRKLAPGDRF
jgi:site-specific recombinase XerC